MVLAYFSHKVFLQMKVQKYILSKQNRRRIFIPRRMLITTTNC